MSLLITARRLFQLLAMVVSLGFTAACNTLSSTNDAVLISDSTEQNPKFVPGGRTLTPAFDRMEDLLEPGPFPKSVSTTLSLLVGKDGSIRESSVFSPSGHKKFDNAALASSRKWRMTKPIRNGEPAEVRMNIPVIWFAPPTISPTAEPPTINQSELHGLHRLKPGSSRVVLHVLVAADGSVKASKIAIPSGQPKIDEAAASEGRKWRFTPGRMCGVPADTWILIPVDFRLTQ